MTYKKDWDIDESIEMIRPHYNDAYRRYDLSMQDVIEGINNSNYPINGNNIRVPDGEGGWTNLPDALENGGGGGSVAANVYRLEMLSTNGNIIKDTNFATVLSPMLFKDNKDITATIEDKYFKWTRVSGTTEAHQASDAEWNLRWATGAKLVPITHEDVNRRAMFQVQYVAPRDEVLWVLDTYDTYMNLNK